MVKEAVRQTLDADPDQSTFQKELIEGLGGGCLTLLDIVLLSSTFQLTISFCLGLAVMIIMIPINGYIAAKTRKLQVTNFLFLGGV
jgi:hypothetical protein